jgi:GrpB-like predicted nucleotidyltransferase (UPF0157 family)
MRGRQLKMQGFLSWMAGCPQRRANYTAAKRRLTTKEQRMYQEKGIIPKEENEILED